jgi:hypothetical protein
MTIQNLDQKANASRTVRRARLFRLVGLLLECLTETHPKNPVILK